MNAAMPTGLRARAPGLVAGLLAVAVLATLVAVSGTGELPPDEHEVLVLRTVQEMAARGEWIVPWFNGEPRLNKPPLSYWLTALVAHCGATPATVAAWQGRLVSAAAGLAVLGMVALLALRLYASRALAVLASLLTATSAGWFGFVHDARPDMLYCALCLAGVVAFMVAAVPPTRDLRTPPLLLMWGAFGLATLAKGPHVPAMLLVGMAAWRVATQRSVAALGDLRWARGLLLMVLLTVPWWLLLQARLPPTAVSDSQLGGTLLRPGLSHLFNGYYLYRPLQLLLPWLLLLVPGWILAWRDADATARAASRLVFALVLAVVVGLSLGPQQRYFYLLPVMPLLVLLGARGWLVLCAHRPRIAFALGAAQGMVVLAAWCYATLAPALGRGGLPVAVGGLGLASAAGWAVLRAGAGRAVAAPVLFAVLTAAVFVLQADGTLLWSRDRANKAALAAAVVGEVASDAPLVSYALTPVVYVYASGRTVPRIDSTGELAARLAGTAGGCLYVLTEVRHEDVLARLGHSSQVAAMPRGANDRAGLYCLRRAETLPD